MILIVGKIFCYRIYIKKMFAIHSKTNELKKYVTIKNSKWSKKNFQKRQNFPKNECLPKKIITFYV